MYDELKKSLRECCGTDSYICNCENCIMKDKRKDGDYTECVDALGLAAADAIEELSRENESLAKSVNEASEILHRRWIPVTERLPEEHVFVLIRQDDDRIMVAERVAGVWWYRYFAYDVDRWDENEQGTITHWMPLPEPPKE